MYSEIEQVEIEHFQITIYKLLLNLQKKLHSFFKYKRMSYLKKRQDSTN